MTTSILVTGADGMLGKAVVRAAERRGVSVVAFSRHLCDITDRDQVAARVNHRSTVINCAGIVRGRTDASEALMASVNGAGPHILTKYVGRLLQVSTDCVFDGRIDERQYTEDCAPCPEDAYGKTKLIGEVVEPPHLTVRVSFVGLGQRGLLQWLLSHPEGAEVPAYTNWLWNGWTADALALRLVGLALDPHITGLVHLPGPQELSKATLLWMVKDRLRKDLHLIPTEAPEPRRMLLTSRIPRFNYPLITWGQMLDDLEEEYLIEVSNVR